MTDWMNRPSMLLITASVMMSIALGAAILARSGSVEIEPCMDDEQRERVRGIVLRGIEEGLQQQVKHVFEIWMRDDTEQPKRAITGMNAGIRAYVRSRASALKWSPPKC